MPDWKEEITRRLQSLKLAPAREAEIVEEVSQHLEDRYKELVTGGATGEEAPSRCARRAEEREFTGNGPSSGGASDGPRVHRFGRARERQHSGGHLAGRSLRFPDAAKTSGLHNRRNSYPRARDRG